MSQLFLEFGFVDKNKAKQVIFYTCMASTQMCQCHCVFLHTCGIQTWSLCLLQRLFQQQLVNYVSTVFKGMFALYFSQTPLYPVAERSENGQCWQPFSNMCVCVCVCLCWSATTVLVARAKGGMEGRRGDEGGLGKALQIRSNYSSPPFALTALLDLCLPSYNQSLLSLTLPSSLWCCCLALSVQLWALC